MSNQIATTKNNFVLSINSFEEGMNYCEVIAKSSFCPDKMRGKPGDIFIAIQMGAEIGLSPMQAIQNIAVISGRPCVWGDAALAVCQASRHYISHREWFEGSIDDGTLEAFCATTRKNSEEHIRSFSIKDAIKASLWKKPGTWQQYPERMLQMRARGFCLRDKFSDALKGMNIAEEFIDITPSANEPNIESNLSKKENHARKSVLMVTKESMEPHIKSLSEQCEGFIDDIEGAETLEELQQIFDVVKKLNFKDNPTLLKNIINAKDSKKLKLQVLVSQEKDDQFTTDEFVKDMDATQSYDQMKGAAI